MDEKSLVAFLEKACGPRTLDVIVCLFACDVRVMILNTSLACNTRTVTFQFVLVVGRGPCHSLLYLDSDTVPARGLGARGVFKPCLSFMTLCPTPQSLTYPAYSCLKRQKNTAFSTMEHSWVLNVMSKRLEFHLLNNGSNSPIGIFNVTGVESPLQIGVIYLKSTHLEIQCPMGILCARVYGIHARMTPITMWYKGLNMDQRVHLLVPNSSQNEPGWLSKINLNTLYDSVILHSKFPHLTNDL